MSYAFANAAERLKAMSRTAGEKQLIEHGALRFPLAQAYSMSPDEEWSKKYMSQGIGPVPNCAAEGGFCPMPFATAALPTAAPREPVAFEHSRAPEAPAAVAQATPQYVQIGQAIGKPLKRRWFRRRSP